MCNQLKYWRRKEKKGTFAFCAFILALYQQIRQICTSPSGCKVRTQLVKSSCFCRSSRPASDRRPTSSSAPLPSSPTSLSWCPSPLLARQCSTGDSWEWHLIPTDKLFLQLGEGPQPWTGGNATCFSDRRLHTHWRPWRHLLRLLLQHRPHLHAHHHAYGWGENPIWFSSSLYQQSQVFYNPFGHENNPFGDSESIFEFIACWKAPDAAMGNKGGSYLTFFSSGESSDEIQTTYFAASVLA